MRFAKKGKFNTEWALKSVKTYAPAEEVVAWVPAIETCRNEKGF